MESEKLLMEDEVSNTLKYPSIKLDALPDKNVVGENVKFNNKSGTHIKKVRFSDIVSQSYGDTYDAESSFGVDKTLEYVDNSEHSLLLEDHCSDFTHDVDDDDNKVERSNFEEKDELLSSSPEFKGFGSEYEFENSTEKFTKKEAILDCEETHVLLSDKLLNESSHLIEIPLSFSIKNTDEVFEENRINSQKDILKKIASISINNDSFLKPDAQFDDFEDSKNLNINEELEIVSLNRKNRSDEKLELQKQSEKINTFLEPYRHKFLTVPEKKTVVFEAWNTVKKKEIKNALKQQIKEEKPSHCSKYIYKELQSTRRKIKLRIKKKIELSNETKILLNNAQQRISKEDMEEKEMAFKSWKKNKDQIIKQLAKIDNEKKQQQKLSILRNEQDKKENAEYAYLSWKSHKREISKNDRMKKNWLKQKDNEAKELKIQQNERALELYNIWLMNKHHKTSNFSSFEDRPAWLPPGKAKLA